MHDGVPPEKTDQASAMINVARNVGGSIGVSLAQNVLAHRTQFHTSRLSEVAIPYNIQFQGTVSRLQDYFMSLGSSATIAQQQAMQWVGRQIGIQASLLAYIDVFHMLTLLAALVIPLAMILHRAQLGATPPAAH